MVPSGLTHLLPQSRSQKLSFLCATLSQCHQRGALPDNLPLDLQMQLLAHHLPVGCSLHFPPLCSHICTFPPISIALEKKGEIRLLILTLEKFEDLAYSSYLINVQENGCCFEICGRPPISWHWLVCLIGEIFKSLSLVSLDPGLTHTPCPSWGSGRSRCSLPWNPRMLPCRERQDVSWD